MLFNSYAFLFAFLPITLTVFFALDRLQRQLAILWLVAASFYFYAFWNAAYLTLLAASIVANYAAGRTIIGLRDQNRAGAKAVATLAVALNLAVLGYYKYSGFFIANAAALLGRGPIPWDVVLPIG